jgi:hypothetical protein
LSIKRAVLAQFAELRGMHVQNWINEELANGYRVSTVKGWFRAFRTMVQDARIRGSRAPSCARRRRARDLSVVLDVEESRRVLGNERQIVACRRDDDRRMVASARWGRQ